MNILKSITLKSIKKNKKRTIGTIMGIIMSVALICAVAGMFASFQKTLVENAIDATGYYHIELSNITLEKIEEIKLNKDIKNIIEEYELGYSQFNHTNNDEEEDIPYIKVLSLNKNNFDYLKYKIQKGRFPENNNEIILSEKVLKKSNYKIGDEIELNIGKRKTNDGYDLKESNPIHKDLENIIEPVYHKYKIVGTFSKYNTSFLGITTAEKNNSSNIYLSLRNPSKYKTSITNLLGAKSYQEVTGRKIDTNFEYHLNNELLRWETLNFSPSTTTMLITVFSVVISIIVITSVFCIRNSFAISVVEKMTLYGMLASVGATKKQIKKSVIYEGTILGIIGIPIGILCGILADFILIKVINVLIGQTLFINQEMCFVISWLSILIAIILGFITIYLSSITSAIKASKVSPIENLKNTKEINLNVKKLKTPKWISSIFKTGGTLAYKNLKRSKRKYRTTVISLTVSIFVFITMNAFINEAFKQGDLYYTDYDYNIVIRDGLQDDTEENIQDIKTLDNIDEMYVLYNYKNYSIKITDINKINFYDDEPRAPVKDETGKISARPSLIAFDDETFKKYINKIGFSYEDCKDKAILYDTFYYESLNDNKSIYKRRYNYKKGDTILAEENDNRFNFIVGAITDEAPYGYENSYYDDGIIVVNKKYFTNIDLEISSILIQTSKADGLERELEKLNSDFSIYNYDEETRAQRGYVIVISIFLYGFITVISLIGATNIFNTITANMELRSREFAILKSIGMTKKEFNRMINLETLFYSTKALLYGIILGLIGTLIIHNAFGIKNELKLNLPYTAIVISIIFVFIIVSIIMKYSIHKINKQNIIETIRNENI